MGRKRPGNHLAQQSRNQRGSAGRSEKMKPRITQSGGAATKEDGQGRLEDEKPRMTQSGGAATKEKAQRRSEK
jgi:hypothetical protein